MKLKSFIYTLLVIVIALSTYQLVKDDDIAEIVAPLSVEGPNFKSHNLVNTSYNDQGQREYTLYSDSMEYFSEENQGTIDDKTGKTYFENPMMNIYAKVDSNIIEWKVTAKKGVIDKDKNLILTGDVLLDNQLPDASFDTLATQEMTINLNTKDFYSNVEVKMKGPLFTNTGQSIKGNFEQNIATLSNKVQGYYEQTTP